METRSPRCFPPTLGTSDGHDRKHALYTKDLVGYLGETQPEQWEKSTMPKKP